MSGHAAAAERCECPPCPGRGNDGHGLTHCAECCFGTGVEADLACPVHGVPDVIEQAQRPDPWGDDGPVHHPTRFDLPIPDEPPF